MTDLALQLTSEGGHAVPTDLGRIAAKRAVRVIEFRPLLVDGGLSVMPDGFRIFVRCDSDKAEKFTKLFWEDGTGKSLPAPIAKRVRYTIAHEIAHTLLFDIKKQPPRPTVETKKGQNLRGLEHACNDVAGAILLPETAIRREFLDLNELLDPDKLRAFAERALVSLPTLVIRLAHLSTITLPVGVVASIRRAEDCWILTAITRNYALRDLFSKAVVGNPVETLTAELTESLFSGTNSRGILKVADLSFECSIGTTTAWRSGKSCLITLRRL